MSVIQVSTLQVICSLTNEYSLLKDTKWNRTPAHKFSYMYWCSKTFVCYHSQQYCDQSKSNSLDCLWKILKVPPRNRLQINFSLTCTFGQPIYHIRWKEMQICLSLARTRENNVYANKQRAKENNNEQTNKTKRRKHKNKIRQTLT